MWFSQTSPTFQASFPGWANVYHFLIALVGYFNINSQLPIRDSVPIQHTDFYFQIKKQPYPGVWLFPDECLHKQQLKPHLLASDHPEKLQKQDKHAIPAIFNIFANSATVWALNIDKVKCNKISTIIIREGQVAVIIEVPVKINMLLIPSHY